MTAPSADGTPRENGHDEDPVGGDLADAVDETRAEFAATLDAIEERFDLTHRWSDIRSRVRTRVAEQPVPVIAIAIAGTAVAALAAFLLVRAARR